MRRTATAFAAAALCAGFAVLVWATVFRTEPGQAADVLAFRAAVLLQETPAVSVAAQIAALCDPGPYAVLVAALTLYALAARGARAALVVPAVTFAANAATQVLKPALAAPRIPGGTLPGGEHVVAASWPSGHATAAMALALCAVLVAPAPRRAMVAAAGAVFAAGVAGSVVLLGWHLPSDVLGGYAVAGAAAAVGAAALGRPSQAWPSPGAQRTSPAGPLAPRERMKSRSESLLR